MKISKILAVSASVSGNIGGEISPMSLVTDVNESRHRLSCTLMGSTGPLGSFRRARISVAPFRERLPGAISKLVCVFFINLRGASGVDPVRIDFKPGANPSTTPFFERGLDLNYSRWFYWTRPALIGRLQKIAGGLIQFEGLRLQGVIGGLPFRTPTRGPRLPTIRRLAASRGHRRSHSGSSDRNYRK